MKDDFLYHHNNNNKTTIFPEMSLQANNQFSRFEGRKLRSRFIVIEISLRIEQKWPIIKCEGL